MLPSHQEGVQWLGVRETEWIFIKNSVNSSYPFLKRKCKATQVNK